MNTEQERWRDTPTLPMTEKRATEFLAVIEHGREKGINEQWACRLRETLLGFLQQQKELEQALTQKANLQELFDEAVKVGNGYKADVAALTAELATLRERMEKAEKYIHHEADCVFYVGLHEGDCSCGLSALTHPLEGK